MMINNKNLLLTIILSIICLLLVIKYCTYNYENFSEIGNRSKIWVYWETLPNRVKPPYIDLCLETIKLHCKDVWDIIVLDNNNIYNYLPNLRTDINTIGLAQKTDYIRVLLLKTYGGLWIDADTIVMNDLKPIKQKLDEGWDYIGFGCTSVTCTNGYPRPSNGVMASQPNSKLMTLCLEKLNKQLDKYFINKESEIGYFDLGKLIIWDAISVLQQHNYDYYHFPSGADGSRDKEGNWINVDNHISYEDTEIIQNSDLLFVFLENNKFSGSNPQYNFFSKLDKETIINGKWWISKLFRQSLN